MTKQNKTIKSTDTADRLNFKMLIRSALVAGVVAGFGSSTSAQTQISFPTFPTDAVASPQLTEDVTPCEFTAVPKQLSKASTSQRITRLLGLKKHSHASNCVLPSAPTFVLPSFPSTEPTIVKQSVEEQAVASESRVPTICHSSSCKPEFVVNEPNCGEVVTASADEKSLSSTQSSIGVVETASEVEEELVPESLGESFSESLADIEIPANLTQSIQIAPQRLPEIVKRPPAMQLYIGGNSSPQPAKLVAPPPVTPPAETASSSFSLSDSSESQQPKAQVQPTFSNPMNVRIEGEPVLSDSVPTNSSPNTVTVQKSIEEPSSRAGHKVLSDNRANSTPSIGERLEVGLHESTNLETSHVISGLSVEHPELCQVLKSGERSVSFVGLKPGQTRVALFTIGPSGDRKIEIREVVIAGTEIRQADMKSLATEISRSVHNMFPDSKIEIIAEAEGLTVQGYAGSEVEAKKIIGLVRRTSLQPVVDRLATYK